MDLWTNAVQTAVLALVVAVLSIIIAWVRAKGNALVAAWEAQALEATRKAAGDTLATVVETAVHWVEQRAAQELTKWTSAEKLAVAVEFVRRQLPDVTRDDATAAVEALLNKLQGTWATPSIATPVATVVTSATATDVATKVAEATAAAEALASKLAAASKIGAALDVGGLAESFGVARAGDA